MARRRVLTLGLCMAMTAFGTGLSIAADEAAVQAAPQAKVLPSIVVTNVSERRIVDRVVATGTVMAVEEIYVLPLVEGLSIRSLGADIGDRVVAGSTLAVLNDDALVLQKSQSLATVAKSKAALAQYQAQLAEAKANADEAVRVSDRSTRLAATGTVSTSVADTAKASAAAALARLNSAEQAIAVARADIEVSQTQIADIDLRLDRTAVKAPFGGIVSARAAKIGAVASGSGTPLFTIIRDGAVELRADVSETDLLKIATGQTVNLVLAGGSETVTGKVRLIAPTVNLETRLGTVHISIDSPEKARVGMYASAEVIVEDKRALVLPLTAVNTGGGKTVTRRVEDGVVHSVDVTTGIQDGEFLEITSGVKTGDLVVAKAGAYVRDGDRIKPVQSTTAATN